MPGPVILTLTSWVEQHLQEVLKATSKKAFDDAFDAFLSEHATITLNGVKVSRSHYKQQFWQEESHERSATVTFKGIVEVPKDPQAIIQVRICSLAIVEEGMS